MKLIVNPHKIILDKEETVNEKEINISKCTFEFADEITDEFVKEAYFTYKGESYKKIIVNNECTFPQEVLQEEGTVEVGVVAYLVENETEITRYNPSPIWFKTDKGSLRTAQNSQPITPSELEQYEQALQDGLSEVNDKLDDIDTAITQTNNLDLDANKVGSTTTVEITKKDGTTKEVNILDGADGVNGRDGQDGITPTIGDNGNWYLGSTDTGKPSRGEKGETGATGQTGQPGRDGTNGSDGFSPIANVSKTGNTATITITDKVGTTTTTITDGQDGQDGVGIPSGGTQGQVLIKNSATDYDTIWGDAKSPEFGLHSTTTHNNVVNALHNYMAYTNTVYAVGDQISFTHDFYKNLLVKIVNDYAEHYVQDAQNYIYINVKNNAQNTFKVIDLRDALTTQYPTQIIFRVPIGGLRYYEYTVVPTYTDNICTNVTITYTNVQNYTSGLLETNNTYPYTPSSDYNPATKKYVDDNKGQVIQYSTMPTASSSNVGKIIQYIGTTDSTYTNGYFYIGTETSGTYSWEQLNVQPSGGGSSKYKYYVITTPDNISSSLYTTPYQQPWYHSFTSTELDFAQIKEIVEDAHNEFLTNGIIPVIIMNFKYNLGNPTFSRQSSIIFTLQNDNPAIKQNLTFYSSYFADGFLMSCYLYFAGSWNDDEFTPTSVNYTSLRTEVQNLILTNNAQTITAKKTFNVLPESSVVPTTDNQLVNKKYVDDNTTPVVTTSSTSTYTIASLTGNNTYKLGEITDLTITAVTTFDKESTIYFESGTTATSISIPDTLTNLGDVPTLTTSGGVSTGTCDASKNYIISVLNNIAIWKKY